VYGISVPKKASLINKQGKHLKIVRSLYKITYHEGEDKTCIRFHSFLFQDMKKKKLEEETDVACFCLHKEVDFFFTWF
jgi:hypothetical protein